MTKIMYVAINIAVSGMGFLRSFVFMKLLSIYDLGMLTIIQTIIALVSISQLGLINGGYRLVSLNRQEQSERVNNLLFSFFCLISVLLILFWLCSFFLDIQMSHIVLLIALMTGVMYLIVNWLTNTLIGKQALRELNIVNLISGTAALLLLPLSFFWGMNGAIVVLMAQPVFFILFVMIRNTELRPTAFCFDVKLIKYILSFGFIPFFSGIFTLINLQIERWTIVKYLGTEALGNFYLVFLFSTIFILIPSSLLNLFFPQCVRYFEESSIFLFKKQLQTHFCILLIYLIIAVVFSLFCLKFFVTLLIPNHINNVKYVFLYIPGLFALCLCDIFSLLFNSSVRLKPILLAGVLSVVLNIILLNLLLRLKYLSLDFMAVIKSILNIIILFFYFICFLFMKNKIFNLVPNKHSVTWNEL
jgi:O-antigen/teichoic acid export membrane protein